MSISSLRQRVQDSIEHYLEQFFRWLFFWETDAQRLGSLIRVLHHSVMYCLGLLFLFVHTLYPSYWLFVLVYIITASIWLQHICCGGCVVNRIERKLLDDTRSFVDPFLDMFHMPITDETTRGVTIMGSTLVMVLLTLELTSRTILNIQSYLRW